MTCELTVVEGFAKLIITADCEFERNMLKQLESLPVTAVELPKQAYSTYDRAPSCIKITFETLPTPVAPQPNDPASADNPNGSLVP